MGAQTLVYQTGDTGIITLMRVSSSKASKNPQPAESEENGKETLPDDSFMIAAVGASAGGLEAFTELFKNLPQDTPMAFVLLQHLDPTHTSQLPEILSRITPM